MEAKIYLILDRILPENLKTMRRVAFVDPLSKFPSEIPPGYHDAGFQEGLRIRIVWGVEGCLVVALAYYQCGGEDSGRAEDGGCNASSRPRAGGTAKHPGAAENVTPPADQERVEPQNTPVPQKTPVLAETPMSHRVRLRRNLVPMVLEEDALQKAAGRDADVAQGKIKKEFGADGSRGRCASEGGVEGVRGWFGRVRRRRRRGALGEGR
ncbi:hypothetical protein QE152_g23216 [Popillia japonica]|uniref:Uncharacterized protein n=1 Tax=Popillia japonica TaxID=7064 RepID=A0AAW1KGE3_POPJA